MIESHSSRQPIGLSPLPLVHAPHASHAPLAQAVSSVAMPVFAAVAEIQDVEMAEVDDAPGNLVDPDGDVVMDDISAELPEPWASFIHSLISSL
jgi:hypothetical protein